MKNTPSTKCKPTSSTVQRTGKRKYTKRAGKVESTVVAETKFQSALPSETIPEKKKTVMYFTLDTEAAIVEYNATADSKTRNQIFNTRIKYSFEKIAENVFNTFGFSYNEVNPATVQNEAISHMVANIEKYNPNKGKAFGYFSIVAKNWFILENNNNYKRFQKHTQIIDEPSNETVGQFVVEPEHEKQAHDTREFIDLMITFWEKNIKTYFPKKREADIAGAVIDIFRHSDRTENFNKKALYISIRDIANCDTQHITRVINRMKFAQANIYEEYLATGNVTGERFSHLSID